MYVYTPWVTDSRMGVAIRTYKQGAKEFDYIRLNNGQRTRVTIIIYNRTSRTPVNLNTSSTYPVCCYVPLEARRCLIVIIQSSLSAGPSSV